jgi:hypothetical protein
VINRTDAVNFPPAGQSAPHFVETAVSVRLPLKTLAIHTKQADYLLNFYRDEAEITVKPNPPIGKEKNFGFEIKHIPQRLGQVLRDMLEVVKKEQEKPKLPDTSGFAGKVFAAINDFNKQNNVVFKFLPNGENLETFPAYNGSKSILTISLTSDFELFANGVTEYTYFIDNKSPGVTGKKELKVRHSNDGITLSGGEKEITLQRPSSIDLELMHTICGRACEIFAKDGLMAAAKFLNKPLRELEAAVEDKYQERQIEFIPPKPTGFFSSQVSKGGRKGAFYTIKESCLLDAMTVEIAPSGPFFVSPIQRMFFGKKASNEIFEKICSKSDASHLAAYQEIKRRNFSVRLSEQTGHSLFLREVESVAQKMCGENVDCFNPASLERPLNARFELDAKTLFLETLKGRHFLRISHKHSMTAPDSFLHNLFICCDNKGGGEIRLENDKTQMVFELRGEEAESLKFLTAKIELFVESPYFLLDELLRTDYLKDSSNLRMSKYQNGSPIEMGIQKELSKNTADCLYYSRDSSNVKMNRPTLDAENSFSTSIAHKDPNIPWRIVWNGSFENITASVFRNESKYSTAKGFLHSWYRFEGLKLSELRELFSKSADAFGMVNNVSELSERESLLFHILSEACHESR